MKPKGLISVVIPIMNEQGNLPFLVDRLNQVFEESWQYEVLFIDDGSTDSTLEYIKDLNEKDKKFNFISFSRNFGHQVALRAGLDHANGDCVISMDGDLQHPPELIPDMINKWRDGNDIVYSIRKDDQSNNRFKRITSATFYWMMNRLSDVKFKKGTADFRLLDKSIISVLRNFDENPLFLRGIINWIGFKQCAIEYIPEERYWGESKYPISKMYRLALTGITSFSIKPLQISSILGTIIASISFFYGLYAIILKLFTSRAIPGWTSTLLLTAFLGGIQLLMIGIIGEYLGKLFIESKRRPPYLIREKSI